MAILLDLGGLSVLLVLPRRPVLVLLTLPLLYNVAVMMAYYVFYLGRSWGFSTSQMMAYYVFCLAKLRDNITLPKAAVITLATKLLPISGYTQSQWVRLPLPATFADRMLHHLPCLPSVCIHGRGRSSRRAVPHRGVADHRTRAAGLRTALLG